MEIAFRNPQFTGAEIVAEFKKTKAYKDAKYPDEAINDSITFVSKLKGDFLSIYGPDAIYLPEFKLRTPADADHKVVGIIDLVVIDKDGQVHIFDFKSSPKSFNDYSQVKTQTFMYQLGIYAQML
jgi:ATP-dependent exoDNAse (exonuclease V) beta subunit